jgi:hypothetical protein
MATQEYNVDQAGLDEPRRTTPEAESVVKPASTHGSEQGWKQEQEKMSYFPTSADQTPEQTPDQTPEQTPEQTPDQVPDQVEGAGAGYGGVTEDEPPHHKIHSEDELLPKPKSGSYYDDVAESESKPLTTEEEFGTPTGDLDLNREEPGKEQALPTPTESGHGGEPTSTEENQDFRTSQSPVDETPAIKSRSFGDEKKTEGGYADPSSAFPEAPVDRKVEEPGYGHDTKTSEPVGTETTPDSPTPKKEGFVQKLMEKLPGHHKTATPETVEHEVPTETGAHKKGLITKIKEKLPGHHHTEHTPSPTSTVE